MRHYILLSLLVCAGFFSRAQTNFIMNPGFEKYSTCPSIHNQISYSDRWSAAVDTVGTPPLAPEYYNSCAVGNFHTGIPENISFYQFTHSGNGMAGATIFYDKTLPHPGGVPVNYRDYFQGHLHQRLKAGQSYCFQMWINLAETSGYAINKIGAYFDDGAVNFSVDTPGNEILSITPQVYSDTIIRDTAGWTKVEGTFIAIGSETHITVGNFFPNSAVDKSTASTFGYVQYAYYLFDDLSLVPTDLAADAGPDNFVEETKTVQIGRVGDTTVEGLDCKWFRKGILIDSGAIISAHAGVKGDADTFVVVQTICGAVKTDTTVIYTVGLGMKEIAVGNRFSISPNPSDGVIHIAADKPVNATATVFDLTGRIILRQPLTVPWSDLKLEVPSGMYLLELADENGGIQRERLQVK